MERFHGWKDRSLLDGGKIMRVNKGDIDLLSIHQFFRNKAPEPSLLNLEYEKANNCVIGGTFDKLHFGHQAFINSAFNVSNIVHLCIMSDEGVRKWSKKKFSNRVDPFKERYEKVIGFLKKYSLTDRAKICKIDDPYSYAVKRETAFELDAILVSTEEIVLKRTIVLNEARESKNLEPLKIYRMPLIVDMYGKPISATRIRANEEIFFPKVESYRIRKEIIPLVREPKGELVDSPEELPKPKGPVIAIGDIVAKNLIRHNYPISIVIIDKKSRRNALEDYFLYLRKDNDIMDIPPFLPVINPKAHILNDAWTKIIIALFQRNPVVIQVYGEEDLMGFPATILAPDDTLIVFGQPPPWDKLVYFFVDEEKREEALNLLKKFAVVHE